MNNFQKWCKELVPVVQAAANGEDIECYDRGWGPHLHTGFHSAYSYRIKPKLITIGNCEFPEPVKMPLNIGDTYYIPEIGYPNVFFKSVSWGNDSTDAHYLQRGLIHLTVDAAKAHARALIQLTGKE